MGAISQKLQNFTLNMHVAEGGAYLACPECDWKEVIRAGETWTLDDLEESADRHLAEANGHYDKKEK